MLLFIDNFDSFTFNLVQYFSQTGLEVLVRHHRAVTVSQALELDPQGIVLGPGPGGPRDAGISLSLIREAAGKVPLFGVCLGMQCMVEAFGGVIRRAERVMHGKTSPIFHDGLGVFQDLPQGFSATRYHSLVADRKAIGDGFKISAETDQGEVMAVRHQSWDIEGVQFHPESILTVQGMNIVNNFSKKVKDLEQVL